MANEHHRLDHAIVLGPSTLLTMRLQSSTLEQALCWKILPPKYRFTFSLFTWKILILKSVSFLVKNLNFKSSIRSKYQTTWPAIWETCMQVRKQQLELDMEQQTGSK